MHRFDDVVVDEGAGEVRLAGRVQPVEPQVFAVLSLLIRERHRVVRKDELLDEVWGSRHVSDAAVTSRIKSARHAVGDTGRDQRVIRTVHGRGYRFVADLDGRPSSAPAAEVPRTTDDSWPLVGRDDALAHALSVARRGDGGILLTGPAGVGKSRLARAVLEALAADGAAVARINGHTEAAGVPLAAFAHLLPDDVVDVAGLQGDLARSVLFQRARRAIYERASGGRLVLMVDDVDRVDRLSAAVTGSLIADGSVFALLTQRVEGEEPLAMEDLVRSGSVERIALGPVADDQLTALLGRVLDGPVDPSAAESLVAASGGSPGMLRQLVESSTARGTLTTVRGIWSLVGGLAPPTDLAAAIGDRIAALDRAQREAVELVALAGDLDLDLAFELISDEVLDELELAGMITVRMVGQQARVRVAHPLFSEILRDELPALRARRHRRTLADALASRGRLHPADRLQLVRLRLASDGEVDEEALLESAALAIIEGDTAMALRLTNRVPRGRQRARTMHLRGEALYLRGRFDEAGSVLEAIELEELDELSAAFVLRRIATWRFFGRWEHDRALEDLAAHFGRWEGPAEHALESYWIMIAGFDGRLAVEALERAEDLWTVATGIAFIESLSGAAMARVVRGEQRLALQLLERHRQESVRVTPGLTWAGPNYASMVEMMAHLEGADPIAARAVLDRDFGTGAPPPFRFVAFAAARLAVAAGEYQLALDWLDPHIQIGEELGIPTNIAPMQAATAIAALQLGDLARAEHDADRLRAVLPDAATTARFDLLSTIVRIDAALGDAGAALEAALEHAGAARGAGNVYCESQLLATATRLGGAERTVDRLGELAAVNELARLRHRAALALTGSADVDAVADELARRGLLDEVDGLRRALAAR